MSDFEKELRELMKKYKVDLVPYEIEDDLHDETYDGYRFEGDDFSFDVSHLEVNP